MTSPPPSRTMEDDALVPPKRPAQLTPWFPVATPPSRIGWYDYRGWLWDSSRMYWNGSQWGYYQGNNFVQMCEIVTDRWRGLAEKP